MLHFEQITPAFVDLLSALHEQCFEKPWTKEDFSSLLLLPTTKGLICEKGFIVCSICGEDAEILTLGVVPHFRRLGIAKQMLEEMSSILKNFYVVSFFLEVNENNLPALTLYKNTGFEQVGRRKNYYTTIYGKQDALVLKKKL